MLRGVAMLLVVLGHTMTGGTSDAADTTVYNVIWALQMPLFMLISGYVTRYSKKAKTLGELFAGLLKKTVAYLLPFVVWTVLIRGFILGEENYCSIKYVLWHMDAGYWFLFSVWTINMVYTVASFASEVLGRGRCVAAFLLTGAFYAFGMAVLASLGILVGLDFLCIKLTLYYMPFYFAGYAFSVLGDRILSKSGGKAAVGAVSAVCLAVFAAIVTRVNLFSIADDVVGIMIRCITSLCGCIAACYMLSGVIKPESRICKAFSWVGVHSLEIYLVHYLFLSLIKPSAQPQLMSPRGALLCAGNFALTLALSAVFVVLLNAGSILPAVLFGKIKKRAKSK